MTTKVNLRRRLLLIVISLCAVLAVSCLLTGKVEASEIVETGILSDGTGIPYTLTDDHVLTIGDGSVYERLSGYTVHHHIDNKTRKVVFKGRLIASYTLEGMFDGATNLTEIEGLSNIDTSSTDTFQSMFKNCTSLKSLDLSSWDTGSLTKMSNMFYGCSSLQTLNISTWNTRNCASFDGTFYNCSSLISLDLSRWNTNRVYDVKNIFYGCSSLKTLNIYNWNLTEIVNSWPYDLQQDMFYGANQLTRINIGPKCEFYTNERYTPALRKESGAYRWYKEGTNNSYTANEMERLNPQKNNPGWYVYTNKGSGSNSGGGSRQTMYRLYNRHSGEHFYTSDVKERNYLISVGWKNEGVGWIAPVSGSPVYRLYNRNGGEHHYTLSIKERNMLISAGWKDEGVGWYSGGSVVVYREYNKNAFANNHNYTPDKKEHDSLIKAGWRNEGTGWMAVSAK